MDRTGRWDMRYSESNYKQIKKNDCCITQAYDPVGSSDNRRESRVTTRLKTSINFRLLSGASFVAVVALAWPLIKGVGRTGNCPRLLIEYGNTNLNRGADAHRSSGDVRRFKLVTRYSQ